MHFDPARRWWGAHELGPQLKLISREYIKPRAGV
jgi:hypothetical protein